VNDVGGRDEVDVDAASALKGQGNVGYLPGRPRQALGCLADVGVLAEQAREVAAGEEDGPAASAAHKAWLFPEMRAGGCHHRLTADAAVADPPGLAIHSAPARA
jgi:hypothetical protein